jgi:5-methylcytosine-specific restriction endonuclease McrA|tara:strand:- start:398 stop:703 length:306 start_codon:yes stop_codon:yes gene_type:complete
MEGFLIGFVVALGIIIFVIVVGSNSRESRRISRRDYYRDYLKSDAWRRKRYVVLKRDNWTCQECGAKATEVHHMKYAKYQIGKEPIHWLVSLCSPCHRAKH